MGLILVRCLASWGVLLTVYLLEREPVDYDPEVVEESEGDHHGPVVAQAPGGVEHEGPVRAGAQPTARVRGAPPQPAPAAAVDNNTLSTISLPISFDPFNLNSFQFALTTYTTLNPFSFEVIYITLCVCALCESNKSCTQPLS